MDVEGINQPGTKYVYENLDYFKAEVPILFAQSPIGHPLFIFTSELKPLVQNFAKYEAAYQKKRKQESCKLVDLDPGCFYEAAPDTLYCYVCNVAFETFYDHLTSPGHLNGT